MFNDTFIIVVSSRFCGGVLKEYRDDSGGDGKFFVLGFVNPVSSCALKIFLCDTYKWFFLYFLVSF